MFVGQVEWNEKTETYLQKKNVTVKILKNDNEKKENVNNNNEEEK